MANIRRLAKVPVAREAKHREVDCTYFVSQYEDGKYLQIDTYGPQGRKFRGKKSQSLRFSPEAIFQLKKIIETEC